VNPYYAFFALVPVIGVPLLLRRCNRFRILATALALGMLCLSPCNRSVVSSVSRDPRSALVGASLLVLLMFICSQFGDSSCREPCCTAPAPRLAQSHSAVRSRNGLKLWPGNGPFGLPAGIESVRLHDADCRKPIIPRLWQDRIGGVRSGIIRRCSAITILVPWKNCATARTSHA